MQPKLDSREVRGRKLTVSENPYLQKPGDTGMGKERRGCKVEMGFICVLSYFCAGKRGGN